MTLVNALSVALRPSVCPVPPIFSKQQIYIETSNLVEAQRWARVTKELNIEV